MALQQIGSLDFRNGSLAAHGERTGDFRFTSNSRRSRIVMQTVSYGPTGDIARPQTETLKAKKPRTMPGRMLLLALNDHNEAVYLSKLDRRENPGGELCNKCSEVANVR